MKKDLHKCKELMALINAELWKFMKWGEDEGKRYLTACHFKALLSAGIALVSPATRVVGVHKVLNSVGNIGVELNKQIQ
jgi:hypothetical protein